MVTLKRIDINWEEPHAIKYDRENDSYLIPDFHPSVATSSGVYQIYGNHPVYGSHVLLYIGQTSLNGNGQTLIKRIKQHLNGRFWHRTGLVVYIGQVKQGNKVVTDPELIKDVESLLIAANAPALNQQHIDWPRSTAKDLLVVNWGFTGNIVPECSGYAYLP